MKRIIATLLAFIASSGFISCADVTTPAPFDVATDSADVAKVSYTTDPCVEGCYTNGDYCIEVICQEKSDESCTYSFVLFSLEDGSQRFFGTEKGIFEYGKIFTVSDITDLDASLVCIVEEDLSMTVKYACRGVDVVSASGRYFKCPDGVSFDFEKNE